MNDSWAQWMVVCEMSSCSVPEDHTQCNVFGLGDFIKSTVFNDIKHTHTHTYILCFYEKLTWFFIFLRFKLHFHLLLAELFHPFQQSNQPPTERVIHFFLLLLFVDMNTLEWSDDLETVPQR